MYTEGYKKREKEKKIPMQNTHISICQKTQQAADNSSKQKLILHTSSIVYQVYTALYTP